MRKPIIAGNWKMNLGAPDGASELAAALSGTVGDRTDVDIVLCPPFTALTTVADAIKGTNIALGAQNMYAKEEGAFTGEISPAFLRACGCKYVILGHSERRQYFEESDAAINEKARFALEMGLMPILCCGELLEQREANETENVVRTQLVGGLKDISADDMPKLVLAYEPVWAIGTGKVATDEQAQEVHAFIRKLLAELYNSEVADAVRIQYGGSVKADNAAGLLGQDDIDGALVGGASLKSDAFTGIIQAAG